MHAVLTTLDVFHILAFKALVTRTAAAMRARGLKAHDAFRLFDAAHAGALTCSNLYSGLHWLGVETSVSQVHALEGLGSWRRPVLCGHSLIIEKETLKDSLRC